MIVETVSNEDYIDIKNAGIEGLYEHSANVAVFSIEIGIAVGLDRAALRDLGTASMIHDIGKVFISKEIVNKPSRLSADEFSIMKTHSLRGYEYARKIDTPMQVYTAIIDHHEKYDGTGYPNRKQGNGISYFGRIIAIADVYDALTSDRPYRKALLPHEAVKYIVENAGNHFDPDLADVFINKVIRKGMVINHESYGGFKSSIQNLL